MRKSAILATVALLALAACGKKQAEAPQSADNGSSEVANAETAKAKFVPGTYTFEPNKRVTSLLNDNCKFSKFLKFLMLRE